MRCRAWQQEEEYLSREQTTARRSSHAQFNDPTVASEDLLFARRSSSAQRVSQVMQV